MPNNTPSLTILLRSLADTAKLARLLPGVMQAMGKPILLLHGGLGAGKTTLIRDLVRSLPGSDTAEVSSPSFTLCNIYATHPPVMHYDLYRLEGNESDADLEEALDALADAPDVFFLLVEWPERLPPLSDDSLSIRCLLTRKDNDTRCMTLEFPGTDGVEAAQSLYTQCHAAGLKMHPFPQGYA